MFEVRYKSHHDAEHDFKELLSNRVSNKEELEQFLTRELPKAGSKHCIYIHIPFCDRICSFCNLNRSALNGGLEDYVAAVVEQIKYYGAFDYIKNMAVDSVYFGGGTPSVLEVRHYQMILQALKDSFNLLEDCEISTETTLHNMGTKKLMALEKLGINRISVGIQTFNEAGRKFFNRTGDSKFVVEELKALRACFGGIMTIDKIYHYPGESLEALLNDVALIKELEIDSVSFYSLMIHQGSALAKKGYTNEALTQGDELYHETFFDAMIKDGGYEVLELTKLAKKGRDAYKYIKIRNQGGNTLPIGKGAGGNIGLFGIYNMDISRQMIVKRDEKSQLANLIYGMLQSGKVVPKVFEENKVFNLEVEALIKCYKEEGYMRQEGDAYTLTSKGIFYGNNMCAQLTKAVLK